MKKLMPLVASIALILVAGIFATAGTMTWYTDEERLAVDPTAHTLDLTLNGGNDEISLTIANVKPGDIGSSGPYLLKNVGDTAGELDIYLIEVVNTESTGDTEFERDGAPGELGAHLNVNLALKVPASGWDYTSHWGTINDYAGVKWDGGSGFIDNACRAQDSTAYLNPNEEVSFRVEWWVPNTTGNDIQGDSVSFTIKFVLEQPEVD